MRTVRSPQAARVAKLETCPLFADLPEAEKAALGKVMTLREYEPGDIIFLQNDRADGFHIVAAGKVRVVRLGQDGREQVLHLMDPGEVVGEVPVFEGGRYPATAVAAQATETLYVPGAAFLDLAEAQPQLLLDLLAVLSRRLRSFAHLIDDLSLKEVSARLAKVLLDLQVRGQSETVTLETTKAVLASRLGTIAETLSRTFAKMQKRKIIRVRGAAIDILDRDALQALAAGAKL